MNIGERIGRARTFLDEELWTYEPASRWLVAKGLGLLQFAVMTAEGFVRDRLLLRASALSYFTVLSLIPMVAIVIGIASAMGVSSNFAELIVERLAAGAPGTQEAILEQIRGARLGTLGTLGAAALFVTTVFGISNIERSFNSIWGVTLHRTWARRFPDYLTVLVVVPLLLGVGLSLATTLKSQWLVQKLFEVRAFALLYDVGLKQAPTIVLAFAFALMFWFLPNTRVKASSAALGGIVAGMLVVLAQNAYLKYSVGVARADALFGTFAQLPLLFVWIYIFWAIVLFGAEVAFAHQNLALYRREVSGQGVDPAERESIAVRIAIEIARAFRDATPAPTAEGISDSLNVPVRSVRDVLARLGTAQIVSTRLAGDETAYQLGRPAERIRLFDILAAVRGRREAAPSEGSAAAAEALLAGLDVLVAEGVGGQSLAELLAAVPADAAREDRAPAGAALDGSPARG